MKIIPREARRITNSNELRELRKRLHLTPLQKDILIGTLLGDGSLELGAWKNCRLSIYHSILQKDYVLWKHKIFKNWTLQEPKFTQINNALRFRTLSHPELTNYRNLFYKNKRKVIPENLFELLNPVVLAVWYMDDGNIRKQNGSVYGYYLNTQSFTYQENVKLSKILEQKFGIDSYVLRNKGGYRLYFGSKSKNLFPKIIEKYIIPSLQYKIR